jgi:hypothetical protein
VIQGVVNGQTRVDQHQLHNTRYASVSRSLFLPNRSISRSLLTDSRSSTHAEIPGTPIENTFFRGHILQRTHSTEIPGTPIGSEQCQKRPGVPEKESYYRGKRDLVYR